MSDQYKNITWDNTKIYKDFNDPKIDGDLEAIGKTILELEKKVVPFEVLIENLDQDFSPFTGTASNLTRKEMDLQLDIQALSTFAYFQLSTEADHKKAKEISSKTQKLSADLKKAMKPLDLFILRSSEKFFNKFISDDRVQETKFQWAHARTQNDFLLSVKEEILLTGLSVDGLHAWGKLYKEMAGNMEVNCDGEKMGLAEASSILRGPDPIKRKKVWHSIKTSWEIHQDSSAAILNAIHGWRHEVNKTRSSKRECHALDKSCHQNKITRKTLSSLIDTTYDQRAIGQRALKGMAKIIGVSELGPWDILAPCPSQGKETKPISFPDAISLISDAFSKFSPDMGEFARMMAKNKWIDSLPTKKRSPGAYCGGFSKVREPRIFMTYTGSMGNVLTLAHELGHAYHNWVMKDLPFGETHYSMTLAETASIFAETLVKDSLLNECKTDQEKLNILWQDAQSAASLLINIPARFEFEKNMVEERLKSNIPADSLKSMMNDAWKKWYETTLTEYDPMFWANKLHFSISSFGFYNYPYLFGYLFSLGLYAQKENGKFAELYKNILKDTGKMTAEDLIRKHLDQNIEDPHFWKKSLSIVEESINQFESLI